VVNDDDRYSGVTREQMTFNGVGGADVTGTVSTPWLSPPTATGADGTKAHLQGTAVVDARTVAAALPALRSCLKEVCST
jgi:hypothetical protein